MAGELGDRGMRTSASAFLKGASRIAIMGWKRPLVHRSAPQSGTYEWGRIRWSWVTLPRTGLPGSLAAI